MELVGVGLQRARRAGHAPSAALTTLNAYLVVTEVEVVLLLVEVVEEELRPLPRVAELPHLLRDIRGFVQS